MSKVHPSAISVKSEEAAVAAAGTGSGTTVLTVWRKSLLFNCEGFTVFDIKGNLLFRVDNYGARRRGEVVLMDADGTPLLTIRRKRLSFGEQWLVYEGDEASCAVAGHPLLSIRKKHVNLLRHRAVLAHVAGGGGSAEKRYRNFDVEGSYPRRSVAVYDDRRRCLAEVQKKETAGGVGLGADVFRLVVQPGFDATIAMAIVVVLEQMFPSRE
ncbi:unnamed protein product [Spirodela intermedia]|uniref:Uncharacterized protein n=1 Tax=Spirodela intermedia TaxID=51605 RepID=A0A7I8JH01_SPIIN|nr:unnamed protein product [Spirodela intermedia]CAA6669211.1 unnamed protein product [Spirodela intermedia]